MMIGGRAKQVVIAADDLTGGLRVDLLLEGGGAGQIGEEHSDGLASRDGRWRTDGRFKRGTAGPAEPGAGTGRGVALRTKGPAGRRSPHRSGRPPHWRCRRTRRRGRARQSGVKSEGFVVFDGGDAAVEHGARQGQLAVIGQFDQPKAQDRIDETPCGRKAVVTDEFVCRIVDSALRGEVFGVSQDQQIPFARSAGFGGQALAQEIGDIVGASADPADLPVQRRHRRIGGFDGEEQLIQTQIAVQEGVRRSGDLLTEPARQCREPPAEGPQRR